MLLSFKKKHSDQTGAAKHSAAQAAANMSVDYSEFVPYYCHYDPNTLLTKNGELLQIIKIATNIKGLNYEGSSDDGTIIRDAIRSAVTEHIQTDKMALWIHTVRKRKSIRYQGQFHENFAQKVQDRWQNIYQWKYQYYNEVYIVVLHDGQTSLLSDPSHFANIALPHTNRDFRNGYLDAAFDDLDRTVLTIMERISENFEVSRLGLVENAPSAGAPPIFYSQPMEFLGMLLNLRTEPMPLPQIDVSEALITSNLTFGFNALETKSEEGKRRFAAILTLKQYREVPAETMDRLLQLSMEFVVSQAFHFVPRGALKQYQEQNELFRISGDTYCIEASGIADVLSSKTGKLTDFGEHQTSIMVLTDEFKQLDSEISKIQAAFAELGLITIREDVKLEECFWSQLPGNFVFIRRKDLINTTRTAGFCRLNRYPSGTPNDNHWGEAVTILPTLVSSPYFFNFHYGNNGHTAIMDFNSFNDHVGSILINFLMTQSRKFDGKLYIFDRNLSANLLFQKLGGSYHHFSVLNRSPDHPQLRLNPFQLPDNKRNRSFLVAWVTLLIAPHVTLPEGQKNLLRAGVDAMYALPQDQRSLTAFTDYLLAEDVPLGKAFAKWQELGNYAGIFDGGQEDLDLNQLMHAFDMTPVVKNRECIVPVFSYLLHKIISELDGRPTIIVLREALDLLDNDFISARLESLMEMLRENNTLLLFTSSRPFNFVKTPIAEIILKNCASHIFIPDDVRQDYALPEFALTDYNSEQMVKMDRQKGDFLLKQGNEIIGLSANLKELDEYHSVFANDIKTLAAAVGKFSNDASGA